MSILSTTKVNAVDNLNVPAEHVVSVENQQCLFIYV